MNIDFDKAWSSLKPELDIEQKRREKKKRRFLIFFWFAALLISGSGIYYAMNNNTKAIPKENVATTTGNIQTTTDNIQTTTGNIQTTTGKIQTTTGKIQTTTGNIKTTTGNIKTTTGNIQTTTGNIQTTTGKIEVVKEKIATPEVVNSFVNIATPLQDARISIALVSNKKQETRNKKPKNISYGLQLNLPVVQAYNILDANSEKNISTAFIPSIWISKSISKKQSLLLFINPYSNYYSSNKAVVTQTNYNATTQQATQPQAQQNVYTQVISFNKLIGIETSITLQHQLISKINIGAGFSSFFAQSALLQNKVIKNNKTTTKESIYSAGKNDVEWNYLQQNFFLARIELNYQFKKVDAGISFAKPISNIFNNIEVSKTPINTNVFLRWKIK